MPLTLYITRKLESGVPARNQTPLLPVGDTGISAARLTSSVSLPKAREWLYSCPAAAGSAAESQGLAAPVVLTSLPCGPFAFLAFAPFSLEFYLITSFVSGHASRSIFSLFFLGAWRISLPSPQIPFIILVLFLHLILLFERQRQRERTPHLLLNS